MNLLQTYRSNPMHDKDLIKYLALYRIMDNQPIDQTSGLHPYQLISDVAPWYDDNYVFFNEALHYIMKKIHQMPCEELEENNDKTHRSRLTSTFFECHYQTIKLPTPPIHINSPSTFPHHCTQLLPSNDQSTSAIQSTLSSVTTPFPAIDDSDDDNQSDKATSESVQIDESSNLTNRSKRQSKLSQNSFKTSPQSESNNTISTHDNKDDDKLSTYVLFLIADYTFATEWNVATFFRDFTTQLNYISNTFHPQRTSSKLSTTSINRFTSNGVSKMIDRRYFQLLAQLYNRYSEHPTRRRERAEQLNIQIKSGGPKQFTHKLFSTLPNVAYPSIHHIPSIVHIKTYSQHEQENNDDNENENADNIASCDQTNTPTKTQIDPETIILEHETTPQDKIFTQPTISTPNINIQAFNQDSIEKPEKTINQTPTPTQLTPPCCPTMRSIIPSCYDIAEATSFIPTLFYEHSWISMDSSNIVIYPINQDPNVQPKSGGFALKSEMLSSLMNIFLQFVLITIMFAGSYYVTGFLEDPEAK